MKDRPMARQRAQNCCCAGRFLLDLIQPQNNHVVREWRQIGFALDMTEYVSHARVSKVRIEVPIATQEARDLTVQ
jgi:hypothetical protein